VRSNLARLNHTAALLLALVLASVATTTSASLGAAAALRAGVFDPPRMAPDFSLPGTNSSNVSLARYRGKVVLMAFGYTNCAAVCPTTLATLAQTRSSLGKAADAVQVIYVTVDPQRDNAARMKEYLAAFDPGFVGATGTPAALAAVQRQYGITVVRHGTGKDYVVAHTSSIFLIDRAGKLRALMPFGHTAADFVHDVKQLMVQ